MSKNNDERDFLEGTSVCAICKEEHAESNFAKCTQCRKKVCKDCWCESADICIKCVPNGG